MCVFVIKKISCTVDFMFKMVNFFYLKKKKLTEKNILSCCDLEKNYFIFRLRQTNIHLFPYDVLSHFSHIHRLTKQ